MKIQINFGDVPRSDAVTEHVENVVNRELKRFGERITRVEVHLRDDNAKKSGPNDKRCVIEARPAGKDPVKTEAKDDDLYRAVKRAAEKLRRALQKRLEARS